MNRKHVAWLYEQLPDWVERGIVSAESAEKVRQRYGEAERGGRHWAVLVFGILGGALIGAGIILLLAHNWEDLTRPVRAVLSFAPLVLAQALAGYVIWKRRESAAWCEGAGTFWTLAIGATISLVAQTYNLSGDFGAFMLTWILAALPIVYLLNSSAAAMLYWSGATAWAGYEVSHDGSHALFWPLLALALPQLWMAARINRYQPRVGWMLLVLAVCGAFGVGFSVADRFSHSWVPVFAGYFAALYMIGAAWFDEGRTSWQRPLQTIGALGVIALTIVFSFRFCLKEFWQLNDWTAFRSAWPDEWPDATVAALCPLAALALWGHAWMRRDPVALLFGGLPVLTLVASPLHGENNLVVLIVLMNLYALGLGVGLITIGVRDQRLGVVNLGLLVTATLIIARFFDSDMSFVVRGLAFIGVGIGFLVANVALVRRMRGAR